MTSPRAAIRIAALLAVASCAAGSGPAARPSPTASSHAAVDASVVVAPFMVVQYLHELPTEIDVVTVVVKARADGSLRVEGFSCPDTAPSCDAVDETVRGTLGAVSPYSLSTRGGSFGDLRLRGPGARKTVLASRCPMPSGQQLLVTSDDFDQITWTGTVDGRPLKRMSCNFYVRSGTARFSGGAG